MYATASVYKIITLVKQKFMKIQRGRCWGLTEVHKSLYSVAGVVEIGFGTGFKFRSPLNIHWFMKSGLENLVKIPFTTKRNRLSRVWHVSFLNFYFLNKNCIYLGTSLEVQWLRLGASTAGDPGSIRGRGTKIPQATWHGHQKNCIFVQRDLMHTFIVKWLLQSN